MSTYKLTAKRRAIATYLVAQRYAHLRQRADVPNEQPADTLARAASQIAAEHPGTHSDAIARMALGSLSTRRGNGIARWSDATRSAGTWARRASLNSATLQYLGDLLTTTPTRPQPAPPVRVNVVGTIDAEGATVHASTEPLQDGQNVMRLLNAKLDGQPPEQRVEYVDPLAAGQGAESIDYTGEPLVRAALVDALRERRRGRTLRGLDSGELDLSRIAPTALGVDLERAYSRRIRPDVRGVAVWIALDGSTSMDEGYPSRWTCAQRAAAMILRALERERITTAGEIYGHGMSAGPRVPRAATPLRAWGAPIVPALETLARFRPQYGTDAPDACAHGAAQLARRHEPRRVMMFLCDEDVVAAHCAWTDAARAGVEIWPLLVGSKAESGAAAIAAQSWSAIPPIVVTNPDELVSRWARALREHLGRVNA